MSKTICVTLCMILGLCLVGCHNGGGDVAGETPEATAKAFADAMQKGQFAAAATAYAYAAEAKEKNENWNEIPAGQQNSIIKQLQNNKAKALANMKDSFKGDVSVGAAQMAGNQATVTITCGGQAMALQLVQDDGKWRISGSE